MATLLHTSQSGKRRGRSGRFDHALQIPRRFPDGDTCVFRLVDAVRLASDNGIPRLPHAGQGIDAAGAASTIGMAAAGGNARHGRIDFNSRKGRSGGAPKNVPGQLV